MSYYVSLGEADRRRFDCKEWLPVDLVDASVVDVEELSERFGFDPIDDWPEAMRGQVSFEDAGQGEDKRKRPRWYLRALVWLALHQSGHDVTWDEAGTVQLLRLSFRHEEQESGKDEPETSPSGMPDASTTSPSPSSSG